MKNCYQIIASDMLKVNDLILLHLCSREQLVEVVSKYLVNSGGKRVRPTLTLLCSGLFCYKGEAHVKLAAAVEFIHTATLLHDDVVDDSSMRRFQATANIVWGNKTSILVGDFLFSQAFKMMVDAGSMEALSRLSTASAIIAEGEVMQLARLSEKRMLSTQEYEEIIHSKTAELFGAACEVGGIIALQDKSVNKKLSDFGVKLGIVFQIVDDALDYFGKQGEFGKNIGDDFYEGKITLPIILLYNMATVEERELLEEVFFTEKRTESSFKQVCNALEKYNIKHQIIDYTTKLTAEGQAILEQIPGEEIYREGLKELLYQASSRAN